MSKENPILHLGHTHKYIRMNSLIPIALCGIFHLFYTGLAALNIKALVVGTNFIILHVVKVSATERGIHVKGNGHPLILALQRLENLVLDFLFY